MRLATHTSSYDIILYVKVLSFSLIVHWLIPHTTVDSFINFNTPLILIASNGVRSRRCHLFVQLLCDCTLQTQPHEYVYVGGGVFKMWQCIYDNVMFY